VVCPNWSPTNARCVGTSKQSKNTRTEHSRSSNYSRACRCTNARAVSPGFTTREFVFSGRIRGYSGLTVQIADITAPWHNSRPCHRPPSSPRLCGHEASCREMDLGPHRACGLTHAVSCGATDKKIVVSLSVLMAAVFRLTVIEDLRHVAEAHLRSTSLLDITGKQAKILSGGRRPPGVCQLL
jgi:hypothetical protein